MKKFNFRLERFLKYKEIKEQLAQKEYIQAKKRLEEEKLKLEGIKKQQYELLKKEKDNRLGKIDLAKWKYSNSFLYDSQKKEDQQIRILQKVSQDLDKQKQDFIKISILSSDVSSS